MKKIMFLLSILLLSNISTGKALENSVYYSNYGDWSDYSLEVYTKTELKEVEIERRYKWFKNKERGEYLSYEEGLNKYSNVSIDNYKYTNYSEWQTNIPDNLDGRVVETKTQYAVKKIKPIKTIYIVSGNFKTAEVDLNKIEIYNKGKKINFQSICGDCSSEYKLKNDSGLILELNDFYYFDDLNIVIRPTDMKNINSLGFLVTSIGNDGREPIFYAMTYKNKNDSYISIDVSDFSKVSPSYEAEVIYDEKPTVSVSDIINEINFYRYKDKLYYFYDYDKDYLDGYFVNKEDYEKDEASYLDYFRYRNRDKIELNEFIEITSKNEKINDHISSTTDYEVIGNINYSKNGLYRIKVKTYFLTKNVSVLVNISDNESNDDKYKELEDNYNNLSEEKEKLADEKNKLLDKYQDLEKKYDDLLKEKNNKNYISSNTKENLDDSKCKEELKEITLKNNDNEKKLKLSNQAYDYLSSSLLKINDNNFSFGLNWYFWLLILIILLLILLALILKKRKNKNKF